MTDAITDLRWFVVIGLLLVLMAMTGSWIRRLPLSTSVVYLAVGALVGPLGLGLLVLDPVGQAPALELLSEVAVIISLFTAGLKLREPLHDRIWRLPIRLASISMLLTVAMVTVAGVVGLGLPLGAAVLLGAILAPTDPVLASDVQVSHAFDRDRVRFTLTGEAGLNDGTAFPLVMLGLGLLGLHEIGALGLRWVIVDVGWAIVGGLALGGLLGTVVAKGVLLLRSRYAVAVLDELLLIGLIALVYGVALALGTYGFLAVFAAGLAVRRVERQLTGEDGPGELRRSAEVDEREDVPEPVAAAAVAQGLLSTNEALERIAEVGLVLVIGAALAVLGVPLAVAWLGPLLFLVLRPTAVIVGLWGSGMSRPEVAVCAWFGIRGIGSVYYLAYAITHGLEADLARTIAALTFALVTASIIVHGISVTPFMDRYSRRQEAQRQPARGPEG